MHKDVMHINIKRGWNCIRAEFLYALEARLVSVQTRLLYFENVKYNLHGNHKKKLKKIKKRK